LLQTYVFNIDRLTFRKRFRSRSKKKLAFV
jgi:hypothetical protein